MNEGVEVDRVDAGEGAADGKTFALVSLGCVGHRLDGAQGGCGVHAQARKGHGVCGDSRHGASLVSFNLRFNYPAGKLRRAWGKCPCDLGTVTL